MKWRKKADVARTTVAGLAYHVSVRWITAELIMDGEHRSVRLVRPDEVLDRVDVLSDQLRDTVAVALGQVPELHRFSGGWGRSLLPEQLLARPPDVLVIVPHGMLHSLPLHLVAIDDGSALGTRCAVAYASSMTMYTRCAALNPERTSPEARDRRRRSVFVGSYDPVSEDDTAFQGVANKVATKLGTPGDQFHRQLSRTAVKSRFLNEDTATGLCVVAHGVIDRDDHQLSGLLLGDPLAGSELSLRGGYGMYTFVVFQIFGQSIGYRDIPLRGVPGGFPVRRPTEMLTVAEVEVDLRLRGQLVVLLGCSAGHGLLLQGDHPASLAEAFLRGGASTVIAPLWDLDIASAELWADVFFDSWAVTGRPAAFAARDAQRALMENGFGLERAGALTVRGDWW